MNRLVGRRIQDKALKSIYHFNKLSNYQIIKLSQQHYKIKIFILILALIFTNFVLKKTMNTTSYKRTYSLPFSFDDILKLIKSFSIEDKVRLEKELEKETLVYRAQKLSEKIRQNDMTMEDIVIEVSTYRNKQK